MAVIPLQIASRSLDTGGTVSYPNSTPVADAFSHLGDTLQGVAQKVQQKADQQDGFKAQLEQQKFSADLGGLEDKAVQNAPADASGLHDSVYGQIDPKTGTAVKPGSFDQLFDSYLEKIPQSKREEFIAKKEVFRAQGSARLAQTQYGKEQDYYKVEIGKSQDDLMNAMLQADPSDAKTFEAFKQQQLDLIDKSGLPKLEKEVARTNWLANADETLFKAKLEKDPEFAGKARAALGLGKVEGPVSAGDAVGTVVNKIIGVESGGSATAKNPTSSASGLGQFLDSTWLNTIKQHRPDIWAAKSRAEILALKSDPTLGREMTTAYTKDNAEFLQNKGIQLTPGNIYLAHFLGPQGAANLLKADPGASVASVVGGDVVRANSFLAGKSVAETVAWAAKKMGGQSGAGAADPAFANIPADRRQVLANEADRQVAETQRTIDATQQAAYTSHKDALELSIVQGQTVDEGVIAGDKALNDGDKATLIRSLRSQNETTNQLSADLSDLAGGSLVLDPYASKDKTRADNIYSDAIKRVPAGQQGAVASAIIEQTGVVPQPVVNSIRRGLSSTNPSDVAAAAQQAQRIASFDPAALSRRDGGSEAQQAADDFAYFVDKLNLSPDEAARRMIDNNTPEKKQARKALEPAAKEFVKEVQQFDLANEFDDSIFKGDPALGFSPGAALGIQAEFVAIAEDQFFASNGDPEIAKNRAVEEMKRLYGVTRVTGRSVIMKHPPEKYWPKSAMGTSEMFGGGPGSPSLDYAKQQLDADLTILSPDFDKGSIQLVTTPETDAMVKRGELPGYAVLYKDANGVVQTIPGKLWRPATDKARAFDQQQQDFAVSKARANQVQERQGAPYRVQTPTDILSGNDPTFGGRNFVPPPMTTKPTVKDKLDDRRKQLLDNNPDLVPTPGNAM